MLTKRSTPVASASARRCSVASTLVRIASAGCCSSSVRCFSAAAWKTTCGRHRLTRLVIDSLSRRSASISSGRSRRARPSIESCTACNADSSRSSISSCSGAKRWIWRHNSDPIEPPAPVTRTRLPVRYPAIDSSDVSISRLPSRSATVTSRMSCRPTPPSKRSRLGGRTFTSRCAARAVSVTSPTSSRLALGIAMSTTVAAVSCATRAMSLRVPMT